MDPYVQFQPFPLSLFMRYSSRSRRLSRALCGLCLAVLFSACDEGPAAPTVYTHPADGRLWAAIVVPDGTPDARTWLPYVVPSQADGQAAIRAARQLQGDADRLRRGGEVEAAQRQDEEAAQLLASALSRMPPPQVLTRAIGSLDVWTERAREAGLSGDFPDVAERMVRVGELRAEAGAALQRGDTLDAVKSLTSAGALIREQSPAQVAHRVLTRAEMRIVALAAHDEDAARALRLLRHARESLAQGDSVRALRRALYALQLADQVAERNGVSDVAIPVD